MMNLLMLGFFRRAAVPCAASDRYNRQPIVVHAQTPFTVAGIGCVFARSLSILGASSGSATSWSLKPPE
jgi:hypothetical protein